MYESRLKAAESLAPLLKEYEKQKNTVVCALPRGGVVIGALLAKALSLPLELICAKKIAAPGAEEFALGATTNFGEVVWYPQAESFSMEEKLAALEIAKTTASERFTLYYHNRLWPDFKGKTVLLVDDGIATGATMECALAYLREKEAKKVVIAAPVAPLDTYERFSKLADECVIPLKPVDFYAVGQFYEQFPQVTDQEVLNWVLEASPTPESIGD